MSEELINLTAPEMQEVQRIVGKPCKLEFTIEGKLPLTGFKVRGVISLNSPEIPWSPQVSAFNLTQFPGNCGIMVTHETFQPHEYRRKGLSIPIQKMKEKIAKHYNYTLLVATTIPGNCADRSLEKAGFKKVPDLSFTSRRTANKITTWVKAIL